MVKVFNSYLKWRQFDGPNQAKNEKKLLVEEAFMSTGTPSAMEIQVRILLKPIGNKQEAGGWPVLKYKKS